MIPKLPLQIISRLGISRPALLLDSGKATANIEMMRAKAERSDVRLRPHFKTHQSAAIGEWFRSRGITAITVSSVSMAEYFATHGWTNITIAILVNPLEIDRINELAHRIRLQLLVDSVDAVTFLQQKLRHAIGIFIKIDTGYHRTGVEWSDDTRLIHLAQLIHSSNHLHFRGILTHSGHTYNTSSVDDIKSIYDRTVDRMNAVKHALINSGIPSCDISIGDTPGCSIMELFSDIDEIRPGNFIFYDLVQAQLGACMPDQIAVVVACPVIGIYPDRHDIVIHGGAVHFSKQSLPTSAVGSIYGYLAPWENDHWHGIDREVYVKGLSQEHGVVHIPAKYMADIHVGDVLLIYPVHSCLTANLFSEHVLLEGDRVSNYRVS